jgi:hypothetical protein
MNLGSYLFDCLAAFTVCILPAYGVFLFAWRARR